MLSFERDIQAKIPRLWGASKCVVHIKQISFRSHPAFHVCTAGKNSDTTDNTCPLFVLLIWNIDSKCYRNIFFFILAPPSHFSREISIASKHPSLKCLCNTWTEFPWKIHYENVFQMPNWILLLWTSTSKSKLWDEFALFFILISVLSIILSKMDISKPK